MGKLVDLPDKNTALPGRDAAISLNFSHAITGLDMREIPEGNKVVWLGLGCFWGAERLFWQLEGVTNTAVGYAGGFTVNPTYEEVCSGLTGHAEVVQVVYDPNQLPLSRLLKTFWEEHDPTQGMRQGNDIGTQYRSVIYGDDEQVSIARESLAKFQSSLAQQGLGQITTEIQQAPVFYYAEQYHQQYLHKNPNGYCGLKGTGAVCPI